MKRYLSFAALCVGIAVDVLFWKKTPGISFAIFITFCLALGFWLLHMQHIRPARNSFFLLIPILFFCIMTFLRKDPFTTFLNYVLTLFSAAVLVMTFRSGIWLSYNLRDYVENFFHLIGSLFVHPKDTATPASSQHAIENPTQNRTPLIPILRGILLALPVLFVFITLLSSADMVFAQKLDGFLEIFKLENIGEYLFRGSYILIIAYFFVGLIRHAAARSQPEKMTGEDKPLIAPFLGFTETFIILGSVILLFGVFVAIQFSYLFFGQSNITLTGFTYSEYAQRGFGELVAVAVFSLLLLQGLGAITKREEKQQKKTFSLLISGLVVTVLIILVSAFQRLLLYESAYGFSELRTYAHVFMIWLGILLVAVVILEITERQRAFANLALAVLIGFTATLNFLNVDAFIARQNINRAVQGQNLDESYLAALSEDAVPALVQAYSSSEIPSATKDEIGAALVCHQIALNNTDDSRISPWQSIHLSTWRAEHALEKIQGDLSNYWIQNDEWPVTVISSNGTEYSCMNSSLID
jgi:Ca2+/Na+ antiporter